MINDEALKAVTAKAIFEALEPEKRDLLLQEAIKQLIAPGPATGSYGIKPGPSKLEDVFANELRMYASRLIREKMDDPESEFRKQLDVLIDRITEQLFTNGSMSDKIESAVGEALEKVLRGY